MICTCGQLHPLPIPDAPWDTISVDFIVELPESNGKDGGLLTEPRALLSTKLTELGELGTDQFF